MKLFVYGTLKPGESNHDRYCQSVTHIEMAIVYGALYALPMGYPALTIGESFVQGSLLTFASSQILTELDELEEYQPDRPLEENEYYRQKTKTFSPTHQPLGTAWVYMMELEKAKRLGGILLPEGNWTGRNP
jgi:gamma-glutamylcyclotransferase (GGCT)/AIG2-like uncharacterized protein YtfP